MALLRKILGAITCFVILLFLGSGILADIANFALWLFILKNTQPNISVFADIVVRILAFITSFSLVGLFFKTIGWFNSKIMSVTYGVVSNAWYNPTQHNFNFTFIDSNGAICFELTGALFDDQIFDDLTRNYYANDGCSTLIGKTISFHGYGCNVYGIEKHPSVVVKTNGGQEYIPLIYAVES